METVDTTQTQKNAVTEKMAAMLEAEKQNVSQEPVEMILFNLEKQKTVLLSNMLQDKVKEFEKQLQEKDNEILNLKKLNDDVSCNLSETTDDYARAPWLGRQKMLSKKRTGTRELRRWRRRKTVSIRESVSSQNS